MPPSQPDRPIDMTLTVALPIAGFAIGALCALRYRVAILLLALPLVGLAAGLTAQAVQGEAPVVAALVSAVCASFGYFAAALAGAGSRKRGSTPQP
jgi:hypothetical protein